MLIVPGTEENQPPVEETPTAEPGLATSGVGSESIVARLQSQRELADKRRSPEVVDPKA
jgi:hypothetical protein